ncbi:hypothetical protein [Geminocystis herdmanii]|uniref:hypothetical protein n=1 Tax=Geminocystis herdmanii TaxID=669359 RepID=UPI00034862E6|nr:hypothetical protein [Geminocystis herdmanii]
MSENSDYIEVKAYSSAIPPSKAKKIAEKGVSGVISGGPISDKSKKIFNDHDIWYRENVEPSDLESESREIEKEN